MKGASASVCWPSFGYIYSQKTFLSKSTIFIYLKIEGTN